MIETEKAVRSAHLDLRRLPALSKQLIDKTELPARYKAARKALQECSRLDELKDISDKHAAIAHYAKQIKDDSLLYYAERIKLRAFERIGELLKEIPGYDDRKAVAKQNGIDVNTANRAFDAAHMPKRVYDKMIEQTPPPSRSRLADTGRGYIPKSTHWKTREGFRRYLEREERVKHTPNKRAEELAEYLKSVTTDLSDFLSDGCGGKFTMAQIARSVDPADIGYYIGKLYPLLHMLEEFKDNLPLEETV
jgi:hypothetical protein